MFLLGCDVGRRVVVLARDLVATWRPRAARCVAPGWGQVEAEALDVREAGAAKSRDLHRVDDREVIKPQPRVVEVILGEVQERRQLKPGVISRVAVGEHDPKPRRAKLDYRAGVGEAAEVGPHARDTQRDAGYPPGSLACRFWTVLAPRPLGELRLCGAKNPSKGQAG